MRYITFVCAALMSLLLTACGGSSSSPQPLRSDVTGDANPQTAPLVGISFNGFDPERTNLRFTEGEIITFRVESIGETAETATLSQISGPTIDFGTVSDGSQNSDEDLDTTSSGDDTFQLSLVDVEGPRQITTNRFRSPTVEFRAPNVTRATTLNFRFQSASPTMSRVRNIPIIIEDDALALTLTGQVSKGLVLNTEVELFSVDSVDLGLPGTGNREIIKPVDTDDSGEYSFTVPLATDLEELLRFEVEGDDADMICDAPQGCNESPFGAIFEVEDDLDLRALVEVPPFGTTRIVNINILTTLASERASALNGFRRVSPENLTDATRDVASVFGLPNQDFSRVPFIDVTQPFISSDENAVRIAMIGGGILGATFLHSDPDDDEDYLEELEDFIDEFSDRQVFCRNNPNQTTLSVEDIMAQALDVARINGDAFTQGFFQDRLTAIRSGSFTCDFVTPPRPSEVQ